MTKTVLISVTGHEVVTGIHNYHHLLSILYFLYLPPVSQLVLFLHLVQ